MKILRKRGRVANRPPRQRGFAGPGGGRWGWMQNPSFHRGTSDQIAGLYPWIVGSGAPMIGVPIGRVKRKQGRGTVICCDPLSWYERAELISQPSAFILGLPALGKSTLIKRWVLGLDNFGVKSLILGDLKGEYVDLIRALGGQVITVGRGRGYRNILDMGEAVAAYRRMVEHAVDLDEEASRKLLLAADKLLAEAKGRRQAAVEILLTIHRNSQPTSRECPIISEALRILDDTFTSDVPVLSDLLEVIKAPTLALHKISLSRGSMAKYQEITETLEADLESLSAGHGIGEIFSRQTTTAMMRGEHVVFDVSGIGDEDQKLQAAALMLCWQTGFGQVAVSNALADAGMEKQQTVHVVLDELWRVLRAGPGLTERADSLTRLNRDKGVAVTFASHTMDDLTALPTEQDRKKAAGMVERSGIVIAFGLPASEMPRLSGAVKLSNKEKDTLQSWTTPLTFSRRAKKKAPPPGRGNCLIKIGSRQGIAVEIELTELEKEFNMTSKRFDV